MHVGLDIIRHTGAADQTAVVMCRIMLHGLASRPYSDRQLNGSSAFAAAEEAIKTWADENDSEAGDKGAHVRSVARAQFGRKGYEVTTIRDIAAAAGLGTGTVYRLIGSKDRTSCLDHGVVRQEGRRRLCHRAALQRQPVESWTTQLGPHRRARQVSRRVENPARLDASVPARYSQPRPGVHHAVASTPGVVVRGIDRAIRIEIAFAVDVGALRDGRLVGAGKYRPLSGKDARYSMPATPWFSVLRNVPLRPSLTTKISDTHR